VQLVARSYRRNGEEILPGFAQVRWASRSLVVARVDPRSGWVFALARGRTTVSATAGTVTEVVAVDVGVATAAAPFVDAAGSIFDRHLASRRER
jgi:hypothetical protein